MSEEESSMVASVGVSRSPLASEDASASSSTSFARPSLEQPVKASQKSPSSKEDSRYMVHLIKKKAPGG
jgi:hypothetical protein